MPKNYLIRNEDDAFSVLQSILQNQEGVNDFEIRLEGWPTLSIYVKGDKYHQTMTSSMMKGFLELQKAIYRSYSEVKYKTPTARHLTKDERDALEIEVTVEDGSSDYGLDLQGFAEKLLHAGIDKMDGTQVVVVVLGALLILTGGVVFKHYLSERRQEREAQLSSQEKISQVQAIQEMSQQETERTRLLTELVQKIPALDNINRSAYDAKTELIKSARTADIASFQGVELTGGQADLLTQNARRKSTGVRLDGIYRLQVVDFRPASKFRVKIVEIGSMEQLWAEVDESSISEPSMKKKLQRAEWERKAVELKIEAKDKDGEITNAKIIGVVRLIEEEEGDQ